ncbi:putative Site-specific recombinase, phage integrase family [Mesorhizobium metallidurans STM 2683]|uniref:Putative Site-specific recombinase, phage integrase family n=1 Tax=Mesorhizobium metallidurans STM 2683 TaxID=1297569 RepID=M5EWW5_9HYPH|nr:site-specific integrase [Mesorhizobium metallidurans]CCV09559.1 putative Site-specific recombinase, phage integrase family [Mesorhizobium metallidurans STM 2683]
MISRAASDPQLELTNLQAACASLPALPSVIRYFDDYDEKYRSIKAPEKHSIWTLVLDGRSQNLDCRLMGKHYVPLLKHVYAIWMASVDPTTVMTRSVNLKSHVARSGTTVIDAMMTRTPDAYRRFWIEKVAPTVSHWEAVALRAILHSLCDLKIGSWSVDLHPYVRRLEGARQDRFRTVRTGECFVPLDHQALIVDYLDDLTARLADHSEGIDDIELRNACAATISFQYGFRPGQIARLRIADVRLHITGAVHLSLQLAKRSAPARHRVTRRIKREWCPLFAAYYHRRIADGGRGLLKGSAPRDSFLGLDPHAMSTMVREFMADIAGKAWTATDLRHTSAQRLVDAGSSHIGVSEFLGHASLKTANVYFETSPTQAKRVNEALAISPIYASVAEVARTKTIDIEALLGMPSDHQIGGVPHGIPIAGIGACSSGQSLCSRNPVLSCYTCRRFMPLRDAGVHNRVVESLRPVVVEFESASRGNTTSPAFSQLRRTLDAARRVAADIEADEGRRHE